MVLLRRFRNFANFRIITGTITTTLMLLGVVWYFTEGGFEPAIAAITGVSGFLALFQYSFLSFDKNMVADRIALVVGNQNYINSPPLINSINDAEAVCRALKKVGFKVIKKIDPSTEELKKAIYDFQVILSAGGIGLFYYSGHASQIDGRDYILPIDAHLASREEFATKAIDLNVLLGPVDRIIDESPDPNGNIVIYSTASGSVAFDFFRQPSTESSSKDLGDNESINSGEGLKIKRSKHSPFAYAFLPLLNKWNLEIFDFFRELLIKVRDSTESTQVPWIAASVDTKFYFKPIIKENVGVLKILIFDACRNDPFYRIPIYYALERSSESQ
jgi:hypothetical protein